MKNILALCALCVATSVSARDLGTYSIQVGGADDHHRIGLNYHYASKYITDFNDYSVMLHPEIGVAYWKGERADALQLQAVPMFRAYLTPRWFIEGGIGAALFSRTDFSEKGITTRFQFVDNIGIGFRYGLNQTFGMRFTHYSNCGLKKPNPGINSFQAVYTVKF
jgi:lipid A 3-O-deacylase